MGSAAIFSCFAAKVSSRPGWTHPAPAHSGAGGRCSARIASEENPHPLIFVENRAAISRIGALHTNFVALHHK
jgi:hypothetical protein